MHSQTHTCSYSKSSHTICNVYTHGACWMVHIYIGADGVHWFMRMKYILINECILMHRRTHACRSHTICDVRACACMCEWDMHVYISGAFEHVQRTGFWLNVSYACIMLVYNSWNELCMIVREVSCHFASYYQWSYSCVLYAYRWLPQKKKAPGNSPDR